MTTAPPTRPSRPIPVAGPWITEREIAYVTDAVTNGWYGQVGGYFERFEQSFAQRVGRIFAMSLPSCTSGIHLALAALGIGPGDDVIVPEMTWIASAAPIDYVGARPVFVDIDPKTLCLSADALAQAITERTKAIIVVDLYGAMPDMGTILELAGRHGIPVIEDAAEAIGSTWHGRPAGSFGLASVFSFHGSKTVTTGEGGMLVTNDERFYQRCQFLRDHGRMPDDKLFRSTEVGFKYKMSALQAALGLAQIERLDELVARKRAIFAWYEERLAGQSGIHLHREVPGLFSSYWMVTPFLDPALGLEKGAVMAALKAMGIDSRPVFDPLSAIPAYSARPEAADARARNSVAYRLAPYGLNLPSALSLTEADVDQVCACFTEIVRSGRASII